MIKRCLGALALSLALATAVEAAPFLTCDDPKPEEKVTHYTVNGVKVESLTPSKAILYDLAAVPDGDFTLDVKACNVWGCSESAFFSDKRVVPSTPNGNRIVSGE